MLILIIHVWQSINLSNSTVDIMVLKCDAKPAQVQVFLSLCLQELTELKHLHGKMKKAYAERGTELDHHKRRAEQYDSEVRKLRARIDELKHNLASAEDEVSGSLFCFAPFIFFHFELYINRNSIRKLRLLCFQEKTQDGTQLVLILLKFIC